MNSSVACAVVILCSAAAGAGSAAERGGADSSPKIRTLAKGAFSGIQKAKQEVIKTRGDWEKLWREHSARSHPAPPLPKVDFDTEMVVVATLGRQKSGGYSIEIVRVETTPKSLKISVKQTSPPKGSMTIQSLTAPFHFAAIPRSDLKPEFTLILQGSDN